jgi:hypothetical protein
MEMVEVTFSGKAKVPAKYAPLIEAMIATVPDMFQQLANSWIAEVRMQAAKAGCEVDDVIAAAVEEAQSTDRVK